MATLGSFRNSIALELGLDNEAGSDDQVLVDQRVNEAIRDVLIRTSVYVGNAMADLTAGQGDYDLDNAMLKVVAWQWAAVDGTVGAVPERVSPEEIVALRSLGAVASSPVAKVAFAGFDQIMVWPTPDTDSSLTIYYVPVPTEMSDAAHDPSLSTYGGIPLVFHPAVEMYALWRLASMTDDQSSGQGERYRIQYEGVDGRTGMIARIKREVVQKGGRLGRAQLHPSRRNQRSLYARNDQRF